MASPGFAGFATGLAKGLTNQINRRQDNKDKMDQMGLQFRLKELADKKEESLLQSKKEESWAKSAQFLATKYKNPSLAKASLDYLREGYSVEGISELVDSGKLRPGQAKETVVEVPTGDTKPVINSVAKPTTEMPAGVDPNQVPVVAVPEGFEGPDITPDPKNAEFVPTAEQAKIVELGKQNTTPWESNTGAIYETPNKPAESDTTELDRYDAMVKEVAPGLLEQPKKDLKPADEIAAGTDWEYVPPTEKVKIGTMAQEYVNLQQAQQLNDKRAIAQAESNIEILKQIKNQDARLKAEFEGKNVFNYVILDENNTQVETIVATEDDQGNLINPSGPDKGKVIRLPKNRTPRRIDDEDRKRMWETTNQFNKDSKEYKIGAEAVAESLTLTRKMDELLSDPENEGMLSDTTSGMSTLNDAFYNVKSIQTFIDNQKAKVEESINSGDPNSQSYNIALFEKTVMNQAKEAEDLLRKSPLSDKNQKVILSRALYDNYRTLLAYKNAQSNGQYGKGLSNDELKLFMKVSGETKDNNKARGMLREQLKMQIANNDRRRDNLNVSIEEKIPLLGFRLSANGVRLENLVKDRRDIEFFKFVSKDAEQSRVETTDSFKAADVEFDIREQQKQQVQQTEQTQTQSLDGKPDATGRIPNHSYFDENTGKYYKYLGGGLDRKNFIELKD